MSLPILFEQPAADREPDVLAPNVYYDNQLEIEAAKILPGEYYVTQRDMVLVTVLGSCVTACIRDKLSGIGGMNHFMLPDANPDKDNPISTSARYGTFAMEVLINNLLTLGAHRSLLEAKVFGGGNVLPNMKVTNIGQRNSQFALKFLALEKIPVVAKDLVDIYPRKVYFFPKSGKVLVKKLRNMHNDTIAEREKEYQARLHKETVAGEIELFG
jgi:chemotaxis protein CheD